MAGEILDVITSPVCVVTAKSKGRINGMTVAWIMQAAFNPPLIAVSIAPQRFTYGLIKESGSFGINILAENQKELGVHFGFSSGRDKDKFKKIDFHYSKAGLPIIDGVYAYLETKLVDMLKSGDHDLFIGELVGKIIDNSKRPLIFKASDYF